MGYDLHITRETDLTDEVSAPIPIEEWFAYIHSDPEMSLDEQAEKAGYAEIRTSEGKTLRWKSKGRAVWVVVSEAGQIKQWAWFHYSHGEIAVKNPDKETIKKMCAIAKTLKAQVLGDEGEVYT
jgi:hypothetical protein